MDRLASRRRDTEQSTAADITGSSPKNWTYYEIPAGTEIPRGLIITKDSYNKKYRATHYSISPNYMMPKRTFIQLLDHLVIFRQLTASNLASYRKVARRSRLV